MGVDKAGKESMTGFGDGFDILVSVGRWVSWAEGFYFPGFDMDVAVFDFVVAVEDTDVSDYEGDHFRVGLVASRAGKLG